jgi:hypothetical protein
LELIACVAKLPQLPLFKQQLLQLVLLPLSFYSLSLVLVAQSDYHLLLLLQQLAQAILEDCFDLSDSWEAISLLLNFLFYEEILLLGSKILQQLRERTLFA